MDVEGYLGEKTNIGWTNHTFNPWIGCTKVSAGCDHCYAESQDHRWGQDSWGKGKPRRTTSDANWKTPLQWDKEAFRLGEKKMVFCASLADVMDDEAPEGQRERLWELIDKTPNLIWQLLTKRPQRYMRFLPKEFKHENVWLGTSTENQEMFDVRIYHLLEAATDRNTLSFISYEPALGPITFGSCPFIEDGLDWVIFGGESGSGRRPMEQEWAENIEKECRLFGVKFFMKQMGARTPEEGKNLIPASLLIHEFPEVR
jgi:protein gp37